MEDQSSHSHSHSQLRGNEESLNRKSKMEIVAHTITLPPTSSPFKLPNDWIVEKRARNSGLSAGVIDRYYYEPGTRRQFRSLRAVEKYLTEGNEYTPTPKRSQPDNRIALLRWAEELYHKREMGIVPYTTSSSSKVPDDWVVIEKPRTSGSSVGRIDKYYYEPRTGRMFRSLISIERYLREAREDAPAPKALKPGNRIMPTQNPGSQKKNFSASKVKNSSYDFANPPVKVKWVLTGPGGDAWSPFMGDLMVPDSEKQQWAKTFVLSVNYRTFSGQSSKVGV